jgi:class 3 adenylate cyclase
LEVLIETDGEKLEGRKVNVRGMEEFLAGMARSGFVYDFDKRKVRKSSKNPDLAPNWGSLRDGKIYPVTVASIDIVGNSELVRINGMRAMEKAYYRFWTFLQQRLSTYDGRTWSWAGDGGILAFALKGNPVRATQWALEVQATIPIYNASPENPIPQDIRARIGLDYGKVKFRQDTGRIVSDTINFAAHLEKDKTPPGHLSISKEVHDELPHRLANLFVDTGVFEERRAFTTISGYLNGEREAEGTPASMEAG